jgi:hypothetical protein
MKHFGMFLLGFSLGYLLGPVPAHADVYSSDLHSLTRQVERCAVALEKIASK